MQAQEILIRIKVNFQKKELVSAQQAIKALKDQLNLTQAAQMNLFQGVAQAARNAAAALEMQSAAARRAASEAAKAQSAAAGQLGRNLGGVPSYGTISEGAMSALRQQQAALSQAAKQGQGSFFRGIQSMMGDMQGGKIDSFFNAFARGSQIANKSMVSFGKTLRNSVKSLTLWNSIFGRVTLGMLTWQAWRTVASGFSAIADSIVGANMRMQSAQQMFTALSGGSEEIGGKYIQIIKKLSVETGTSMDKLVENAKRLPTQVGQNFEAFTELTRKAIVLGFLDPVQGVEGAMFSLSNFMEGTAAGARSLVQRFELFNTQMVKRAFEQAADPVEALDILFKEANIDVDLMIEKLGNTLPVALSGLDAMFRQFFRVLGEPVMDMVTEKFVKLRNWMRDNQAQLEGLAQAFGTGLEHGAMRLEGFITDILGLESFDAESWFDAGVELMVNFSEGLLTAITDFVLPTITSIAQLIGSFFIGASPPPMGPLSKIREGGANTIKAYIEGLVAGMSSEQIAGLAQSILENVINIEGQVLAQEKAIDQLEKWVDEATDAVEAKRREIKLFDLATEDIPERFTRARRRQLEYELLAAQDEEKRRKKTLELAKEQLKATKDYLRAQERILRALEAQQKIREKEEKDEAKSELDKGFVDVDLGTADLEAEAEKWKKIFTEKLQPLFDTWKKGLADLADFARGFIGADPDKIRGVTEMFEMGGAARTGIDNIIDGITRLGNTLIDWAQRAQTAWDNTPEWLQRVIMGIVGVLVFPRLALGAGLTLFLEDPSDVKGILLLIGSIFGLGGGGLLAAGGKGLVKAALKIPLIFAVAVEGAGGLFTALINILGAVGIGAGGATVAGASALILPVTILVGLISWKGKDILNTYIKLEGTFLLLAFKGLEKIQEWVDRTFAPIFKLVGLSEGTEGIWDVSETTGALNETLANVTEHLEQNVKNPWEYIWDAIPEVIKGKKGDVESAMDEGVYNPITGRLEELHKEATGGSIVPDMMDDIVELFRRLPSRLRPHLETLYSTVIRTIQMIAIEWQQEWTDMVINTEAAMERIAQGFVDLQTMMQELTYMNQQLEYQQAQAATSGTQNATGENGGAGSTAINLSLDADETQRLMTEGVYNGISDVFGR